MTAASASPRRVRIATAGWSVPRAVAEAFAADGSGLARYASRFDAVEINSTFYRSHRASTYARWAETTPPAFRFAVKLPRAVTHTARLLGVDADLAAFREDVRPLGDKLGPLLVQLPPSLAFAGTPHEAFFAALRRLWPEPVVCEPRHPTWFEPQVDAMLRAFHIARVAADPAPHPAAARPGGWPDFAYWRLHGSPHMYYSAYDDAALAALAQAVGEVGATEAWCVFDNTASGAAAQDALRLQTLLGMTP